MHHTAFVLNALAMWWVASGEWQAHAQVEWQYFKSAHWAVCVSSYLYNAAVIFVSFSIFVQWKRFASNLFHYLYMLRNQRLLLIQLCKRAEECCNMWKIWSQTESIRNIIELLSKINGFYFDAQITRWKANRLHRCLLTNDHIDNALRLNLLQCQPSSGIKCPSRKIFSRFFFSGIDFAIDWLDTYKIPLIILHAWRWLNYD